jgi:hypothetical protein
MEHSLNLAARHFVEGVSPTSTCRVTRKVHDALVAAGDGTVDLDALDQEIAAAEGAAKVGEDDVGDFDVGDIVGKALALVNQVGIIILAINVNLD